VARVSVGSGIMRATMGLTQKIAQGAEDPGHLRQNGRGAIPYSEANRLCES